MTRTIAALFSLWLSIFSLAGAVDSKSKIADSRGREKLGLILQFFQDAKPAAFEEKAWQLLDRYAREALALSKQLHDRHAEGLAQKYVAFTEYLRQQYLQALEGYFQSRRIFSELGDLKAEAAVNKEIDHLFSLVFNVFSDFGRSGGYYKKSLAWYRLSKNPIEIRNSLNNSAEVYRNQGDYQKAIPLYLEALQLSERNNILFDSGGILYNLSDMYLKMGNYAESMKYTQQALVFSKKKRQTLDIVNACSKKGFFYMRQNDFPQALSCFQQALEMNKKFYETTKIAIRIHNLGLLYSHFNQLAKAQDYFRQELAMRRQLSDQTEIIRTTLVHTLLLQKQNELPKAEALLLFCESQAKQQHLQRKFSEIYRQLSSLYSLRHDPVKALYYQTLYQKEKDRLPNTTIVTNIQNLIAKHESDQELNQVKVQKRQQIIIAILAVCLLLFLIGILVRKQKSIQRWARNHLFIKDQQLQEKKAQLLDMQQKLGELQEKQNRSRYETSHMSADRGKEYLQLVLRHMQQDRLFLDSDLTLKKLAAKVGANTSYLSQVLNEDLGMGFNDFVNHFRIEAAKKIMLADNKNEWDAVDICFEVGFNSLSSFYRVFKAHAGTTPVEFQRACQKKTNPAQA
jgi:AraC-like DNA-binding protein